MLILSPALNLNPATLAEEKRNAMSHTTRHCQWHLKSFYFVLTVINFSGASSLFTQASRHISRKVCLFFSLQSKIKH